MYRLIWGFIGLYLAYKLVRFLISPSETRAQQPSGTTKAGKYRVYPRNSQDPEKTYTKEVGEEIEYEEIETKHRH